MNVTVSDIQDVIKRSGAILDFHKLAPNSLLHESGLDSMDMMTLFLEIQETYRIRISDEDVANLNSINDIVDYLNATL